ncbi:MAG: transglycosylase SLT domain-containing protein [Spirochaetales bacterium]
MDRITKTSFDRDGIPFPHCLSCIVHRRRAPHRKGSTREVRAFLARAVTALVLPVIILLASCGSDENGDEGERADLEEIEERGTLRVITSYGPLSYFIHRGQPMGFEYELVERFAERLDINVEMIPATDISEMLSMLESGKGDMIAYRLSITADRSERVTFSDTVTSTRQVLVQPDSAGSEAGSPREDERTSVQEPEDLAGREVHVRSGSAYVGRLQSLENEIGEDIDIVEAPPDRTTEELIEQVHNGDIPLTVADEDIARISASFFDDVDVSVSLSQSQPTAWAVGHGSTALLEEINSWLAEEKQEADFFVIYRRYFERPRRLGNRLSDDAFAPIGDQLSPWDDAFRDAADELGWDWRLLAALAFKESRFDPNARSWAGAVGVMQLMPATARQFGNSRLLNPEANIKAAAQFLAWLDETWADEIESQHTRRPFVLASYNVGRGHVQDARRLAEHYGADPDSWEDVSEYMIRKSDPDYYNHEVVKYGYARGEEPVAYVKDISRLYEHYVRFTDHPGEEPPADPT